jgi:hypothetical protein
MQQQQQQRCAQSLRARGGVLRESFYVSYSLVMDLALSLSYSCSGGAEMVSDKYLCWNAGTCYHHAATAAAAAHETISFSFSSLFTDR